MSFFAQAKPKSSGCGLRLTIEAKISLSTPFTELKGHEFSARDRLGVAIYAQGGPAELGKKLQAILVALLVDKEGRVREDLRRAYRYALAHYLARKGRFVIDLRFDDPSRQSTIVRYGKPKFEEVIHVPGYKLLVAGIDSPGVRESLLSDLIHELRHSISDDRTYRKAQAAGVENAYFIYGYMTENQSVAYARQLEDEAVQAEKNFVPQASNSSLRVNYYPVFQALQRLINTERHHTPHTRRERLRANPLFRSLAHHYVEVYLKSLSDIKDGDKLSYHLGVVLKELRGNIEGAAAETMDFYLDAAMANFHDNSQCIAGRLDEEQMNFLESYVRECFQRRQLRLKKDYDQLLDTHHE